jgi:hypothetical protein
MHIEDLEFHHCNRRGQYERGPEKWFTLKLYHEGDDVYFGYWPRPADGASPDEGGERHFLRMNQADVKELVSLLLTAAEVMDSDNAEWAAREAAEDEVSKKAEQSRRRYAAWKTNEAIARAGK